MMPAIMPHDDTMKRWRFHALRLSSLSSSPKAQSVPHVGFMSPADDKVESSGHAHLAACPAPLLSCACLRQRFSIRRCFGFISHTMLMLLAIYIYFRTPTSFACTFHANSYFSLTSLSISHAKIIRLEIGHYFSPLASALPIFLKQALSVDAVGRKILSASPIASGEICAYACSYAR